MITTHVLSAWSGPCGLCDQSVGDMTIVKHWLSRAFAWTPLSQFSFHSFALGTNWVLLWILWALRLTVIGDMDGIEHVMHFVTLAEGLHKHIKKFHMLSLFFSCWMLFSYLAYLAQDGVWEWQLGDERYATCGNISSTRSILWAISNNMWESH